MTINLRVGHQLAAGIGIVAVLVLGLFYSCNAIIRFTSGLMSEIIARKIRPLATINRLQSQAVKIRQLETELPMLEDYWAVTGTVDLLKKESVSFEKGLRSLAEGPETSRLVIEWWRYRAAMEGVFPLALDMKMSEVRAISFYSSRPRFGIFFSLLEEMSSKTEEIADREYKTALAHLHDRRKFFLRISIAGLGLVIIAAFFFSRSLSSRIMELDAAAGRLSKGEFGPDITIKGNDEIGNLALSFNKMRRKIREYQEHLEEQVKERTAQLVDTNARLKKAYSELKGMQAQLVQSEKMATVGQLAAGVAHELNNPAGFVIGNLDVLADYLRRLDDIFGKFGEIEAYLSELNQDRALRLLQEIESIKNNHDFQTMRSDLPKLAVESMEGMQRIQRIVTDLNTFSRSDEGRWESANVHDLIQSALDIAWSEIKNKVEIVKKYADTPNVRCLPRQLIQVFMHLFVNAGQAIAERGIVTVATSVDGDTVVVGISDTGCGMTEEVRKRAFDPFFTTKSVGTGTGLGLSIAYTIIEKHTGTISLASRPGEGSTVIIRLPKFAPGG